MTLWGWHTTSRVVWAPCPMLLTGAAPHPPCRQVDFDSFFRCCAGDDTIDITGHIFTFVQALPAQKTIIVGDILVLSSEVLAGDTIVVYSYPSLQVLGAATVATAATLYGNPGSYPGGYPFPDGTTDQLLYTGPTLNSYYYSAVGTPLACSPAARMHTPSDVCVLAAESTLT